MQRHMQGFTLVVESGASCGSDGLVLNLSISLLDQTATVSADNNLIAKR